MDEGPVEEEQQDPLEPPEEAPPIEIGRDDLNLTPPQDEETDHGGDIVLEPAVDQLGQPLDPAAEGVGEPDPLVLAKSPATLMSTTHQLIPGPASRAAAQDLVRNRLNYIQSEIVKTYGWKWEFEANVHHELLNYWTIRENHGWIWACRVQKCPPLKNLFTLCPSNMGLKLSYPLPPVCWTYNICIYSNYYSIFVYIYL